MHAWGEGDAFSNSSTPIRGIRNPSRVDESYTRVAGPGAHYHCPQPGCLGEQTWTFGLPRLIALVTSEKVD